MRVDLSNRGEFVESSLIQSSGPSVTTQFELQRRLVHFHHSPASG